jgi:hypothetical protein
VARLRNRIRKADYFTDGELLRWPRDKRTTYSGLWALAEDSGCLEDDPFTWKLVLWPSPLDADITVEMLATWRDELVDADKLVPYEAEGKRHLFIRTFHDHEHPRNPQSPGLPLPPWVTWEPSARDSRKGTYVVAGVLPRFRINDATTVVSDATTVVSDATTVPALPCPALPCPEEHLSTAAAADVPATLVLAAEEAPETHPFADFWAAYPNKQGKAEAMRRWQKMSSTDREAAQQAAALMGECVRCGYREPTYCPHGSTFLNQRRWEEWYVHGALRAPPGYEPEPAQRGVAAPRKLDSVSNAEDRVLTCDRCQQEVSAEQMERAKFIPGKGWRHHASDCGRCP